MPSLPLFPFPSSFSSLPPPYSLKVSCWRGQVALLWSATTGVDMSLTARLFLHKILGGIFTTLSPKATIQWRSDSISFKPVAANLHLMLFLMDMYTRSWGFLAREFIRIAYSATTPTVVLWVAHNPNARICSSCDAYQMFPRVMKSFSLA